VLRAKSDPGRLRGIEGLDSPLVGRARELEAVNQVMADTAQGRGHIVSLIGEAGLGKSRLTAEVKRAWEAETCFWAEGRGVAYDSNRPYGVFHYLARKLTGLEDGDTPEQAHQKIVALANETFAPEDWDQAVHATEMLLAVQGVDRPDLQGDAFKRELFAAIRGIWRNIARSGTAVLVMDDLHWADPESIELLTHMIDLVEEVPIVFLCAFRPELQVPSWRFHQQVEADYPHMYTKLALVPIHR